jgi:hypothetical protein
MGKMNHQLIRIGFVSLLAALSAACASTPDGTSDTLASATPSNCRMETPTGSSLLRKTCAPPLSDAERDQAQRELMTHGQPSRN